MRKPAATGLLNGASQYCASWSSFLVLAKCLLFLMLARLALLSQVIVVPDGPSSLINITIATGRHSIISVGDGHDGVVVVKGHKDNANVAGTAEPAATSNRSTFAKGASTSRPSSSLSEAAATASPRQQQPQQQEIVKIVWMFWEQGWDHLQQQPSDSKYTADAGCVCAMYQLHNNSDWDIRLLDKKDAMTLAPQYAYLVQHDKHKRISPVTTSELLRLELLTLYGGVWFDTSNCPFRPLDEFIPQMIQPLGFFVPYMGLHHHDSTNINDNDNIDDKGFLFNMGNTYAQRNYRIKPVGHLTAQELTTYTTNEQCDKFTTWDKWWAADYDHRSGSTWFLAAAQPHHIIFESWLNAFYERQKQRLMDGHHKYPYFMCHCTFTQLRMNNPQVEAVWQEFATLPKHYWSYWNQSGLCLDASSARMGPLVTVEFAKDYCYFVKKQAHPDLVSFDQHIWNTCLTSNK